MRDNDPNDEKNDPNYNFNNDINDDLLRYNKSEENYSKFFTKKEVDDGKLLAAVAYMSIFAILPYLSVTTNRFIKFHAKQGMNLLILEMLAAVGYIFLGFFAFLELLFRIVAFGLVILSVIGFINAFSGNAKKLPLMDKISLIK